VDEGRRQAVTQGGVGDQFADGALFDRGRRGRQRNGGRDGLSGRDGRGGRQLFNGDDAGRVEFNGSATGGVQNQAAVLAFDSLGAERSPLSSTACSAALSEPARARSGIAFSLHRRRTLPSILRRSGGARRALEKLAGACD